jgi:acetyl-CoA carboxylase biotin carboxyl carrier protein
MSKTNTFDLDVASIRKLAKILEETRLSEIEYAEGDRKIRCVGPRAETVQVAAPVAAVPAPKAAEEAALKKEPTGTPVPSPMVGTVYMASSPGAAPFIKVGDKVKEGDTLLIIEAMKVMNPIKAPRAGTIGLILVEDAKPVEYGDTLVVLE